MLNMGLGLGLGDSNPFCKYGWEDLVMTVWEGLNVCDCPYRIYRIAHYRFLNFASFQIILFRFFVITCIRIHCTRVLMIKPWKLRFYLGWWSSVRFGLNGSNVILTWLDEFVMNIFVEGVVSLIPRRLQWWLDVSMGPDKSVKDWSLGMNWIVWLDESL